jgi:aminoglycoside 6'-N-acetyltransferase
MGTELRGGRVLLRSGLAGDEVAIMRILKEPIVAARWGSFSTEEVVEQFIGAEDVLVIEVEGDVIGAIQYHEEEDPMYRHAGIDIFLTSSRHGRGLGTEAIRVLVRHLIFERGHHRLTIDPAADNLAAIRAYERVGFRRVGIMRKYELGPDGSWHDGLLMDMLAEDFQDHGLPRQRDAD